MSEWRDTDFETSSWHDNHIWAFRFLAGDTEGGDWASDLEIDLDVIVEWVCGADAAALFRVAPATLTFHGVTDLVVHVEWGDTNLQQALHPMSIDAIRRELVPSQKVYLDRPYYRWSIVLNWPSDGVISFGAYGFTQRLRAEPVLRPRQYLTRLERARL